MIEYIKKNISVRRKRGTKCSSKVLEKVRGKGIQDKSTEAGHRRKQGQFNHAIEGKTKDRVVQMK